MTDLSLQNASRWSINFVSPAGTSQTIPQYAGFTLKEVVNKPSQATFTVPSDDTILAQITELVTDITIARDTNIRFRGRIGGIDDNVDENKAECAITAVGYEQLLQSRFVPDPGVVYSQIAQAQIIWNLIQLTQAQTSGSLGITAGTLGSGAAPLRDRSYKGGDYIGKLIDDFTTVLVGCDWWIDTQLRLQVATPRRANATGLVLNLPGSLSRAQRKSTASQFRNVVREAGDPALTTPYVATSLPDTRGRWEFTESTTNISVQQTLVEKANGQLALKNHPRATWMLTFKAGEWGKTTASTTSVGDLVQVQVNRGRINANVACRIEEQTLTVTPAGDETVVVAAVEE